MLLGLALALLVSSGIRFRGLVISLLMIPIVLPPVAVSLAWRFSYQEQFGVYNYLLSLSASDRCAGCRIATSPCTASCRPIIWQATPFVFLLLLAGLQAMPTDPFEAAAIDGATPWKIFRTITLPLLRPTLLVVVLLRTIDAARIFDKIYVMTNGGGPGTATETLTMSIYKTAFIQFDFGYAAGTVVSVPDRAGHSRHDLCSKCAEGGVGVSPKAYGKNPTAAKLRSIGWPGSSAETPNAHFSAEL